MSGDTIIHKRNTLLDAFLTAELAAALHHHSIHPNLAAMLVQQHLSRSSFYHVV